MVKHKPLCLVVMLLVIVGGINWGLVGLGMLIGNSNLNLVQLIFGFSPTLVAIVYLLVGAAALVQAQLCFSAKRCACQDVEK